MRRMIGIVMAVMAVVGTAHAGMKLDQQASSCTVAGTATNTMAFSINGQVDNIKLTIGAASTASVSFATSAGVIVYAADITAATDGTVYPRLEVAPGTGLAITNAANSVWLHGVIGDLTCTVVGKPANTATSTVSATVNFINQ